MRRRGLAVLVLVVAACSDEHFLVVTISGRPAVHDVATLRLALGNDGSMRSDDFPMAGRTLPVTFRLSSPDRTGVLAITAQALDAAGEVVGSGGATTNFQDDSAGVLMEGTDFVVNTEVADDQVLSSDYNANGNQLSATADGNWVATYRGKCTSPCQLYARRFDQTGKPLFSMAAASDMAFPITTIATTFPTNGATAGNGTDTIVVWDFATGTADPNPNGVACRPIDARGATVGEQVTLALDPIDVVSVAPLTTGNFAVQWTANTSPAKVASLIVDGRCQPVTGAQAIIAVAAMGDSFEVPVVTGTHDGHAIYEWINQDTVFARVSLASGPFVTNTAALVTATAADRPVYARVVPFSGGFGLFTRWIPKMVGMSLPGHLDFARFDVAGKAIREPVIVTTKSGGDFATVDSFAAATRDDGTALVVWHACGAEGDGSGCGVFGHFVTLDGPTGEDFVIPTTTVGDQTDPSVVAIGDAFVVGWTDLSAQPPDTSGSAVRARIVYVP